MSNDIEREAEYSQGIMAGAGAVVLKDGEPLTVDEIVAELNRLQDARAQGAREAVATLLSSDPLSEDVGDEGPWLSAKDWGRLKKLPAGTKLYTRHTRSGGVPEPVEPYAWAYPLRYGTGLSFTKPNPPEGWEDFAEEWYCHPLFKGQVTTTQPTVTGAGVPDAYAVIEHTGEIGYTAAVIRDGETDELSADHARNCCHEHINEAAGSGVEGAGKWVVRPLTIGTTQPTGGEWVRCEDRLPTEADDDYHGCVWARFEDGDIELMEAEEVEQTWDDDISITHWMPTGLTRPQPPQDREGGEA